MVILKPTSRILIKGFSEDYVSVGDNLKPFLYELFK